MSNVKLGLEKALKDRNRSIYWLAQQTESAYSTLYRMAKKDVKTVDLDILDSICKHLNCEISEIIPIKPR